MLLILLGIVAALLIYLISLYNRIIRMRNNRENAFSDIDVQLRQRADLIPQLVEAVKGYMSHEREVLENVTKARTAAMSAGNINDKIAADGQLSGAIGRLMIASEAYPDLKANSNFVHLQQEIGDMENKLAAARRFFNNATKELNNSVETFPANLFAASFGFQREPLFELNPTQRQTMEDAPKLGF
jgi:LemA protein